MVGPNGLVAGKVRLLGWVTQQKAVAMTGRQRSCAQVADNPVPLPITVLQRTARAAWGRKGRNRAAGAQRATQPGSGRPCTCAGLMLKPAQPSACGPTPCSSTLISLIGPMGEGQAGDGQHAKQQSGAEPLERMRWGLIHGSGVPVS